MQENRVFYSSFNCFCRILDLSMWFWGLKKTQKWPMFGIIFSSYRAESDKKNMFYRKFSPLFCQKKNLRDTFWILLKNKNFSFRPFFYFWSYLKFYFFGQTEITRCYSIQIDWYIFLKLLSRAFESHVTLFMYPLWYYLKLNIHGSVLLRLIHFRLFKTFKTHTLRIF